ISSETDTHAFFRHIAYDSLHRRALRPAYVHNPTAPDPYTPHARAMPGSSPSSAQPGPAPTSASLNLHCRTAPRPGPLDPNTASPPLDAPGCSNNPHAFGPH